MTRSFSCEPTPYRLCAWHRDGAGKGGMAPSRLLAEEASSIPGMPEQETSLVDPDGCAFRGCARRGAVLDMS